jgi:extradiol dioxygenase family protein
MFGRRQHLLVAYCAVVLAHAAPGADDFARALYARGLVCESCSEAEAKAKLKANAHLPIDLELQEIYEEDLQYQKKVKGLNVSHASGGLTSRAAERMWESFSEQLRTGGVTFHENGTVQFATPLTHHLEAFLPSAACDAIESAFLAVRGRYYELLSRKHRRRLETRFARLEESGGLYALLVGCVLLLVVDIVRGDGGGANESREAAAAAGNSSTVNAASAEGTGGEAKQPSSPTRRRAKSPMTANRTRGKSKAE